MHDRPQRLLPRSGSRTTAASSWARKARSRTATRASAPTTRCRPGGPRATPAAFGSASSSRPSPTSGSRRRRASASRRSSGRMCAAEGMLAHEITANVRDERYAQRRRRVMPAETKICITRRHEPARSDRDENRPWRRTIRRTDLQGSAAARCSTGMAGGWPRRPRRGEASVPSGGARTKHQDRHGARLGRAGALRRRRGRCHERMGAEERAGPQVRDRIDPLGRRLRQADDGPGRRKARRR